MTALRVLLVDDEPPARLRLRRLLGPHVEAGRVGEVGEAGDGVEAVEALSAAPYDLALLDIRMPGLDGFEVIERVPPPSRPDVVFTTAYDEYALRAFRANAVDYLLKPVEAERLDEALGRVEARRGRDHGDRLAALLDTLDEMDAPAVPASGAPIERFTIQGRDRLLVIDAADVVAAEVHDGITSLYVRNSAAGRGGAPARHIVAFPLDTLEGRLDGRTFMRVHRNALVNLTCVREMVPWFSGRYKVRLDGGHEVVASRARSRELRDRLSL